MWGLGRGQALKPGAKVLGFELLGEEQGGDVHSWLCNDLHPAVQAELGIEVNQFGLIEDLATAPAGRLPSAGPDRCRSSATWQLVSF